MWSCGTSRLTMLAPGWMNIHSSAFQQGVPLSIKANPSSGMKGTDPLRDAEHQQAPKKPHWHTSPSGASPTPSKQHVAGYYRNHRCCGPHMGRICPLSAGMGPDIFSWHRGLGKRQLVWLWSRRRVKSLHRRFHRDSWGKKGTSEITPAICKANAC